jgi:hypothetical protein
MVARVVATHPAGRNLALIGGFRYRFLDNSVRTSDDIDYHWSGDLEQKQEELVKLFNRVLLPEVRRRVGYDGSAAPLHGPDADSPAVSTVNLAFWGAGVEQSRIEIPVEITRLICADPVTVRTAQGTIHATASDADMIEGKIVAIVNRVTLRHRDIVDLYLFRDSLLTDSRQRLQSKLETLGITAAVVARRLSDLQQHRAYHARATQAVIDTQLETVAADQLNDCGGGELVLSSAMEVLVHAIGASSESD